MLEELYKFTFMTRDRASYLVDRYSERKAEPHGTRFEQGRFLTSVDGTRMAAHSYSPFDVFTLAAATGARTVRFDFVLGETSSRRRGEPFSTEVSIEITGRREDGTTGTHRHGLVHSQGQAPVTALAVSLAVERLLGLAGGAPVAPGLYFPELLIDPAYALTRFREFGLLVSNS